MTKHISASAFDAALALKRRKAKVAKGISKPAKKAVVKDSGNQTVSRFKKDFDNLKNASKAQIEEIRKILKSGGKVKVKKFKKK